jgi:hypothetical protein
MAAWPGQLDPGTGRLDLQATCRPIAQAAVGGVAAVRAAGGRCSTFRRQASWRLAGGDAGGLVAVVASAWLEAARCRRAALAVKAA